MATTILLASVLLEPNRWTPAKQPSLRVSAWAERARAAGFDGWELWENHYHLADATERAVLEAGALPVRVFNTYAPFTDASHPSLRAALDAARRLRVAGIKFNVGADPARWPLEREGIGAIARDIAAAPAVRLLCECHPGTSLEQPSAVRRFIGEPAADQWPFDVILHPWLLGPEGTAEAMRLLGPEHVTHVHVQMRAREDARRFLALAEDAPRAHECLAALAEGGFRGSFTVEFAAPTGRVDDTPDLLLAAAVRDLEFLRTHWRAGAGRS